MNNCIKCSASYEPYKIGDESEVYNSWCEIPVGEYKIIDGKQVFIKKEPKGICAFCNDKSIWFLRRTSAII